MSELFNPTDIPGCFLFQSRVSKDQRGSFSKIYSQQIFREMGLDIPVSEVFYSVSNKGVVRGMHFQVPPFDQGKIVSCLAGTVLDVVLDLRKKSPTFGKSIGMELSGENETTIFVPKGCAHGFYAFEDRTIVSYVVETHHHKDADRGILWNSFGYEWPSDKVILSERDQQFPPLQDFISPF